MFCDHNSFIGKSDTLLTYRNYRVSIVDDALVIASVARLLAGRRHYAGSSARQEVEAATVHRPGHVSAHTRASAHT